MRCRQIDSVRLRQMHGEAAKTPTMHFLTLEPSFSSAQTNQMARHDLPLVVRQPTTHNIHASLAPLALDTEQHHCRGALAAARSRSTPIDGH